MHHVLGRPRDEAGRLIRDGGLPDGVEVDSEGMRIVSSPVPLTVMMRDVKMTRGATRERADAMVDEWLRANPKCGRADG